MCVCGGGGQAGGSSPPTPLNMAQVPNCTTKGQKQLGIFFVCAVTDVSRDKLLIGTCKKRHSIEQAIFSFSQVLFIGKQ